MGLGSTLSRGLSRLRATVADAGEDEGEAVGARWDLWRRAAALADSHPLIADTSVAVAVAMISAVWLVNRPDVGAGAWVLQAGLIVPLAGRRRYPVAVFLIISLVALVQWALGTELVADLALLVALYTVASHRPRVVALGAAVMVEAGAVMASLRWALAGSWLRSLVFLSGLAAAAALLGANLRSRRARLAAMTERAARLERERDQQSLIAAAAERTRIAREMHDIIAHSLAVIISLADGAAAKLRGDPEQARAAIGNVSDIGRQALNDTRRLLGVLHTEVTAGELAPQPGVAQVADLLDQVRATGLEASFSIAGHQRPLPAGLELAAYRIVQEATTNALKHAVGATALAVALDYGQGELTISIADDGGSIADDGGGPALTGARLGGPRRAGHGLDGMSERAAVYGGTVTAGPSGHGWTVRATLRTAGDGTSSAEPAWLLQAGAARSGPAQ